MRKKLKIILLGLLIGMTVLIAALAALYTFTPLVDRAILKVLNRLSGETIQIDYRAISGNLFGT
ncbi:MAG: hypothetical protein KDH84_10185, partial [Calditrichaeota bacterium]|nr:hypothetical protein [Calditrichota bacterium]